VIGSRWMKIPKEVVVVDVVAFVVSVVDVVEDLAVV